MDLGSHSGVFQTNGDPNLQSGFSGRLETVDTMWIVRAGVNYKFGGWTSLGQPGRARSFPRKLKTVVPDRARLDPGATFPCGNRKATSGVFGSPPSRPPHRPALDMAPDEAILREAGRGYDLVVLGVSRRPGDMLFFGNSAAAVLERSPTSILFVAS